MEVAVYVYGTLFHFPLWLGVRIEVPKGGKLRRSKVRLLMAIENSGITKALISSHAYPD